MKGASEDIGLFNIFIKSVRRLADKPNANQELLSSILLESITKFKAELVDRCLPAHSRDIRYVGTDRRYRRSDYVHTAINRAIADCKFEDAESVVIWGDLVSQGLIQLPGTTRQLSRIFSKIRAATDGHSVIQLLLELDVIVECSDCGKLELNDEICWVSDTPICRDCICDNYTWSEYLDEYIYSEYAVTALDENGDEVTIHSDSYDFRWSDEQDCYVHRNYQCSSLLHGYHSSKGNFRPINSEWIKTHGPFYMGCELEVEVKTGSSGDKVEELHQVLNEGSGIGHRAFFEQDGSLSYGFEIITQPMGLDLHGKFWSWLNSADLRRNLVSHNTSTCGLHVHLSRKPLSQLQINKMISFVNHPDNMALIEGIARRYHTNYARIKDKKIGNAHQTNDRYEAINVTNNGTIEFRIFKGSLKYESVMAALEFVNALREFTSPASGVGFNLSQDKFMEFINHSAMLGETKSLRPYINQRLERN